MSGAGGDAGGVSTNWGGGLGSVGCGGVVRGVSLGWVSCGRGSSDWVFGGVTFGDGGFGDDGFGAGGAVGGD